MTRRMAARARASARGRGRIVGLKTLEREKPAAIARPREWNFNVPPVSHFLALYRARVLQAFLPLLFVPRMRLAYS